MHPCPSLPEGDRSAGPLSSSEAPVRHANGSPEANQHAWSGGARLVPGALPFHAELLPNKALQLTGYRVFQSALGIFWHGTSGASLHRGGGPAAERLVR